jgi:hypothetical protein
VVISTQIVDDICDDAGSRVKGDSGPNFLVVSFRDTVAKPLLLGGSRRGAEADRHAVVGVYQTNRDREVGELLLVELGGGCFVVDVGHVCTPVMDPATAPATERRSEGCIRMCFGEESNNA